MIGNHINKPRYPPLQVYGKSTNQNRCNQQQRDSGWMDIYHDIRRLYWLQMQEQSSGEKTHTERCLGSFLVAKFYLKSVFYLHFTCIMLSRCSTMDFLWLWWLWWLPVVQNSEPWKKALLFDSGVQSRALTLTFLYYWWFFPLVYLSLLYCYLGVWPLFQAWG